MSPDGEIEQDPARVLGLLAEDARFRVAAAIALGNRTVEEIVRASGLGVPEVEKALARLASGGLIEQLQGAGFRLALEKLKIAARRAAQSRATEERFDAPPRDARVLRSFIGNGSLTSIPAVRWKRRVVLDYLAQNFEPGKRYSEKQVNDVLRRYHPDFAALRRYLADEGFLAREKGRYWRAGGTFAVD